MPWGPGQSGNPTGRPKIPEETKKLLAEGADKAVRFWLDTLQNVELNYNYRLTAAEKLAAYAFGKPKEMVDLEHSGKIDGFTVNIVRKTNAGN